MKKFFALAIIFILLISKPITATADYADEAVQQATSYYLDGSTDVYTAVLKTGPAQGISTAGYYLQTVFHQTDFGSTETVVENATVLFPDFDRTVDNQVGENYSIDVKFLILTTSNDGNFVELPDVSSDQTLEELFQNIISASTASEVSGDFYEIGPDVYEKTEGQLCHYLRTRFVKIGANEVYTCEDRELYKMADFDEEIQDAVNNGYNVNIYYFVSTTVTTEDSTSSDSQASTGTEEAVFKTQELSDTPWAAVYDWSTLQDGQYAVEIVKNSDESIPHWKLVQRQGDLIITLYKVNNTEAPIDETELRTTFLDNPDTASGRFVFYGDYSDKTIWAWTE